MLLANQIACFFLFLFFSLTFPVGTDESSYWFWIWLKLICETLRDLVPFALFAFRKPATLLKAALLHGYFSRFFDCTNDTRSRKASHLLLVIVGQHFLESLFLQCDISQRCNFNPGISNLFFVAVPVRLYLILLDPVKYVYNIHE